MDAYADIVMMELLNFDKLQYKYFWEMIRGHVVCVADLYLWVWIKCIKINYYPASELYYKTHLSFLGK